jgi:hypothetical protein
MTRIELMKWKATMERILASARNLDRQAEKYKSKAEDTGTSHTVELCSGRHFCSLVCDSHGTFTAERLPPVSGCTEVQAYTQYQRQHRY